MPVEADAAPESRRHRLPRSRLLTIGAAFALVLAASIVGWKWRHPDVSFEYGYGMSMTRNVGATVWTTLADSDEPVTRRLHCDSWSHLQTGWAEATVEYVICELDPAALAEDRVGGFGYGLPTRYVERYCLSTSRPRTLTSSCARTSGRNCWSASPRRSRDVPSSAVTTSTIGWAGSAAAATSTSRPSSQHASRNDAVGPLPDSTGTGLQSRARRLPGRGWIVAGLVLLTAVGLMLAYSLWWTKPTTFTSVGNVVGSKQTTETMHPVTFDMIQRSVHAGTETITLDEVSPEWSRTPPTRSSPSRCARAKAHRSWQPTGLPHARARPSPRLRVSRCT